MDDQRQQSVIGQFLVQRPTCSAVTAREFLTKSDWDLGTALEYHTAWHKDEHAMCLMKYRCASVGSEQSRVPLRGMDIRVDITYNVMAVTALLRFFNGQRNPIEATFAFRQKDCCVTGFQAHVDGKKLVGMCKEKHEAEQEYDDAIASGHGAYLMEEKEGGEDEFEISIGNLPPLQECIVIMSYVTQLGASPDGFIVSVPMTRAEIVTGKSNENVANGLKVEMRINLHADIGEIQSDFHSVHSEIDGKSAMIKYQNEEPNTGSDFLVHIKMKERLKSFAIVETHSKGGVKTASTMITVVLEPQLKPSNVAKEVIFLVDRSGSMSGNRIKSAKNALQLFLRALPIGTLFNIVGFGSSFASLFPQSYQYNRIQ